jgi:hypothetical protein
MAFPKRGEWSTKALNAGTRGFNLLRDFEREMHRAYPGTQDLTFGYFSDIAINEVSTMGWRFLKAEMFDVDDWNTTVGLRFSLQRTVDGNLKYGDNYIMIMHKEYRNDVILPARKAAHDQAEDAADEAAVYVHPDDPEKNKMMDHARELSEKTSEKYTVRATGDPDLGEAKSKKDNW